jgi:serine/threonine-protein kinase
MSLTAGVRLGVYEVVSHIGSGGMGDVYRARDTKLGRDVALKILPDSVAHDLERVARFKREAQVLAALNHTNIAAIYGFEEAAGSQFLVLELVDGPTLAERLVRLKADTTGTASATSVVSGFSRTGLPLDEALALARQIADALEAAHEKGIIHRDLKPANIAFTGEGQVKVLDFGLAKALGPAEAGHYDPNVAQGAPNVAQGFSPANLSHSPTLTFAGTQMGVILGTAAYMAPEQAKGRAADKRCDVWAFGCVLYEMLTGARAFQGEDISDTLAAVLRGDPDWDALPKDLSPAIATLVRKCLEKDRRRRIGDVSTIRFLLDEPLPAQATASATPSAVVAAPSSNWKWAAAVVGALIATGAIGAVTAWNAKPAAPAIVTRFPLALGEGQLFTSGSAQMIAISNDGSKIAYTANLRLYLRSMSDVDARPIPGTELNPRNPTFSPDGASIAFLTEDGTLKRIAITGGAPLTICARDQSGTLGTSWSGDSILYGESGGANLGIVRVAATGGKPELIVKVSADEFAHGPQMLPDGEHVLFTLAKVANPSDRWDKAQVVVQSIRTGERKTLVEGGSDARFLPTGHIVYALGGVVFAVRFDPRKLQVLGGPVPVIEGVRRATSGGSGSAQFSVSSNGSLVYVQGPVSTGAGQQMLGLIDRKGATEPLKLPAGAYRDPRVSPDGKQIAFGTDDGKEASVWVYDLAGTASMRRLTLAGKNRYPVWSPDGQRIAFQSDREGDAAIFWQRADGSGTAERLTKPEQGTAHVPESWSLDGKRLLFGASKASSVSSMVLSLDDRKITAFGDVRSSTPINATFSPDGKWVAYTSANNGIRTQIYVQPNPPTGAVYQITRVAGNAHHPFWSRNGQELYYIPGSGQFAFVTVTTRPTFAFSDPVQLSRGPSGFTEGGPANTRQNDSTPDARVVAVIPVDRTQAGSALTPQLQVVINWFEELKARVPAR